MKGDIKMWISGGRHLTDKQTANCIANAQPGFLGILGPIGYCFVLQAPSSNASTEAIEDESELYDDSYSDDYDPYDNFDPYD